MNGDGTTVYSYASQGLTGEVGATTAQVKGMPTMTLKSTVGLSTATWLLTVQFYDKNLHPIQTQKNNLINYTLNVVTDYATTVPDFTGASMVSLTKKATGSTTTVLTTPTYDVNYRVTAITQSYNGGAPVQIAAYNYSELGQLINKGLGVSSGTANLTLSTGQSVASGVTSIVAATNSITFTPHFTAASGSTFRASIAPSYLQQVDFRYNIRGQLVNINNSTLTGDSGHTEEDNSSVFGMQLLYNTTDSNLGNTAVYNGKLSAVKWMTKDGSGTNSAERAYKYTYDALDRYTGAAYAERSGSGSFSNTSGWSEAVTAYDENGNIQTLNRNATMQGSGTYTAIDNLTYTYASNNANQLYTVTDATGNSAGFGIYAGGSSSGHYTYDANGNMLNDPYKNMSTTYNVLNKTDVITMLAVSGRNIQYIYDANGSMIRKVATGSTGGTVTTTDYIDGFVYVNSTLSYFSMPEGRIVNNGGALTPEYIMADQQGNARVTFNNTGSGNGAKVIQENSYYGFGMVLPGSPVATPTTPNNNLYNGGSEWQNDFSILPDLMQTFYRNYDAALGRWTGVDPQAEAAESLTTYQYAGNNPIMGNDPLGNKVAPPVYNNLYNSNLGTAYQLGMQGANWVSGEDQDDANWYQALGGAGGGGGNGDYSAYWNSALSFTSDVLEGMGNNSASKAHFAGNDFTTGAGVENAISQGYYASAELVIFGNGSMSITAAPFMASTESGDLGLTNFNLNGSYYADGNQQYPTGLKDFVAIASGEVAGNRAASRAIASTLINRIDAAGSSLNDPNWLSKSIHIKGLGGTVKGNYQILQTPNQYEYKMVMGMDINQIVSSNLPYIQGAMQAYYGWGVTDYSNGAISWSAHLQLLKHKQEIATFSG